MVDEDRREKVSKSAEYEKPQTSERYVNQYGADVVRLWVASQDYRNDIVVSQKRIDKVGETYRIIRNALRYQLSNLYDFDPATHAVADSALTGLDRWILSEFAALEGEIGKAYEACEFHVVYQRLSQFIAVELSAVYHDVVKDRLYTDAANSPRRRSTQTALHRMVTTLCKVLAPILAFTADEAWEFVPGHSSESAHALTWDPGSFTLPESERATWKSLLALRELALPELEKARQAKLIGKSLEAKLSLSGDHRELAVAVQNVEALRELLNVSQLEVEAGGGPAITVRVTKADGEKCERCWHWETDVGSHPDHPTICARCVRAVDSSQAPVNVG
jgi:isoleucyl-tRNA synthetase